MCDSNKNSILILIAITLGVFAFATCLAYHNIADGDLWARLAQGSSVWLRGSLIHQDIFAFTRVLPEYIDHEWGAGLIFYSLLRLFGPGSLLIFKILAALGALSFAVAVGRLNKCEWPALLLLGLFCSAAIFSGYVLVVRSQVLTYLFFAITLFCLESIRRGGRWPSLTIIFIMMIWANTHGGFVAGLGIIAFYAAASFYLKRSSGVMFATMLGAIGATFINPYGVRLWRYLIPALLHSRAYINEWHPMSMTFFRVDPYTGFRILFLISIFLIISGWDKARLKERLPGLFVLLITVYLALKHRRHAPFFGLSAAAFLGPYMSSAFKRIALNMPEKKKADPMIATVAIYWIVALLVAWQILPKTSLEVWSPLGFYPVRECDILMYSKAEGNLAVSFPWGNYAMWRLYPRIKISQCGRYETVYPEATIDMNRKFFYKTGEDWDRLVKAYPIDYVIMESGMSRLQPDDLISIGFRQIYSDGFSALWARNELAASLIVAAGDINNRWTIEPLDARIPEGWWE
ncbi:MAG: hypothetical protein ISS26_01735 [Candidatus Omnitrophica bacterium]|nr:hypothetical protein [Candidatus Omnitrophota bacterium]